MEEQRTRSCLWEVIFTIKSTVFCFLDYSLVPEHSSRPNRTVTTAVIMRGTEKRYMLHTSTLKTMECADMGRGEYKTPGGVPSDETLKRDIAIPSFHKS
jgi:hypothetical protein